MANFMPETHLRLRLSLMQKWHNDGTLDSQAYRDKVSDHIKGALNADDIAEPVKLLKELRKEGLITPTIYHVGLDVICDAACITSKIYTPEQDYTLEQDLAEQRAKTAEDSPAQPRRATTPSLSSPTLKQHAAAVAALLTSPASVAPNLAVASSDAAVALHLLGRLILPGHITVGLHFTACPHCRMHTDYHIAGVA